MNMNKVREAIEFDKESDSPVILQYEGIILDTESVDIMYDVYEGAWIANIKGQKLYKYYYGNIEDTNHY